MKQEKPRIWQKSKYGADTSGIIYLIPEVFLQQNGTSHP